MSKIAIKHNELKKMITESVLRIINENNGGNTTLDFEVKEMVGRNWKQVSQLFTSKGWTLLNPEQTQNGDYLAFIYIPGKSRNAMVGFDVYMDNEGTITNSLLRIY